MKRVSLKITGAQGQGVNSVGEMCAKGLKRSGYCVFGYREYMSLIKGGHSSYQLDVSHERIESSETGIDILVCFNHHGLEQNAPELKRGGIILHQTPQWTFPAETEKWLKREDVTVMYLPVEDILERLEAKAIFGNVLITSVVWSLLDRPIDDLKALVREQFGRKGEEAVRMNFACIDEGVAYKKQHAPTARIALPDPDARRWKDCVLVTGSQAMGLGLIHGGCRMYVGYPMTPSSPLLSFMADMQNDAGLVIKQAEDEITAAQMMSGAMAMGTRAATGTSGGGFDLMSETVSMNAMIENPSVFVLAQRPGPATGLPTWTAQGDLLLAVGAAHGEFPRIVLCVSDAEDCFRLSAEAFNLAEEWQTPVILMTDKQTAEVLFTADPFDQKQAAVRRGRLVTKAAELAKLNGTDRFDPSAKDGVSARWLPGSKAATYCMQADEHSADGSVDETKENAVAQMEKRMKKLSAIAKALPEPEVLGEGFGNGDSDKGKIDMLVVSWGSNKGVILDALRQLTSHNSHLTAAYLHYTYLWPLKTKRFLEMAKRAKKIVLVECNQQGQLGLLLRQQTGVDITDRLLAYDGRPWFCDALVAGLRSFLPKR
ncbi:MAG: 2-oxoglutarate ferredoxin oxidoreductase subunit alpha [Candidatus Peregrinibacteria bacterium Gr01-1014_25]|nr:MAG: 2-oxoglutarate ferredoxin oxidoreductase subunit alpha [Candidatus Peregrinibacteria bacterium Gr01-1014_25]